MRPRTSALLMGGVLVLYLVALGWRGVVLLRTGTLVGVLLGLALLVLPLLGAWALWREVRFGAATERLARELEAAGGLPPDDLPRTASGRPDPEALPAWFARFTADVEAGEHDWAAWFRLSCAYDAARDRGRARAAMRHAICLHDARSATPS